MSETQLERRYFNAEVRVSTTLEHPPMLTGHAAIFDSPSEEIFTEPGWREVVRRGAFAKSIRTDDVQALINHDNSQLIGRVSNGTLLLEEDEIGLKVRIFPPETSHGRDILTLIRGKFITKMSFGFTIDDSGQRFDRQNKIREIIEVRKLFDVSPVSMPAYPGTDISARIFNAKIAEIDKKLSETEPKTEPTALQIAIKEAFLAKLAARQAFFDSRTPMEDPFDARTILKNCLKK